MNIFFTGDTHFGHANIIRYSNRPWIDPKNDLVEVDGELQWVSPEIARRRAAEMDAALIFNWNRVVAPGDTVYHLGDFCFGSMDRIFLGYLEALNGRIVFIKGNHDWLAWRNRQLFQSAHDTYLETKVRGQDITLCHYSLRVWNKSHYGAWHLYGHSHGSLPDDPNLLAIDVGVDCHNFTPISFEQVTAIMAKKKFKPLDHHGRAVSDL